MYQYLRNNYTLLLLSSPSIVILFSLSIIPLILILVWSFWTWDPITYWIKPILTLNSYFDIFSTGRIEVLIRTLVLSFIASTTCLIIGFPAAYCIHFIIKGRLSIILLMLFTIPFLTSHLIRTFSWRLILGRTGLINNLLMSNNLVDEPIEWLLFSDFAVGVGLIASYLPFVIFPLLLSFRKVDENYLRASSDLGANLFRTIYSVVIPLSMPGLFAGYMFVFAMCMGSSTEVQLLGGAAASMLTIMINDVMRVVNFPLAFSISTFSIIVLFILLIIGNRFFKFDSLFKDFSW
jgi:ABC-type spermidine/putrescine transport system permease subunit I